MAGRRWQAVTAQAFDVLYPPRCLAMVRQRENLSARREPVCRWRRRTPARPASCPHYAALIGSVVLASLSLEVGGPSSRKASALLANAWEGVASPSRWRGSPRWMR